MSIWATFIWIISQLQLVVIAEADGGGNFAKLTKEYGVKYGPAKLFIPLARKYIAAQSSLCTEVLTRDIDLKTGNLQYTDANQNELLSCLDVYSSQLCALATTTN